MRLLLSADTMGGVWTFALELARALGGQKVEKIALATMGAPLSPQQRAEVALLPHVQVYESGYKLEWMDDPWDDVARAGDWLLEVERAFRPDVVHLNGTLSHGALAWQSPVLVAAHSCVTSWWQAVKNEAAPPPAWDRYRHEVGRGLRAADMVVAPTRALLKTLERNYGPLPRTSVVPNGRDAARFLPAVQKQPFVLAAGRVWDEAKNIAALAHVAPGLPWPVYVAGEAERPGGGSAETGRIPNLHFSGRLAPDCLAGYLSRAAIYALPARYEPFGLSVLEAGLAGCALVLGDIASLREVWGSDAALFVPPDDPDALRDAICRLITRPAERERLAARAHARALAYSPERMARGYQAAYASLACP